MTIWNGQTGEWCWMRNVSRLKMDKNLKDENFKWPNWGMIWSKMPQLGSERKWPLFGTKFSEKINWPFWWWGYVMKMIDGGDCRQVDLST